MSAVRVPAVSLALALAFALAPPPGHAAPLPGASAPTDLGAIRARIVAVEGELLAQLKRRDAARAQVLKIRELLELHRREREAGTRRLTELERFVAELEARRETLRVRIAERKVQIRSLLSDLRSSSDSIPYTFPLPDSERLEAPARRAEAGLADRGAREIEELRVDLADADELELRISEERGQLTYLVQDMKEEEQILELHKRLQTDVLRRSYDERVAQIESYRKLKAAEGQVEELVRKLNTRKEIERVRAERREVSKVIIAGEFSKMRGRLPAPAPGEIASRFGKGFDPASNLNVFRKGVEIRAPAGSVVRSVYAGKTAYAGQLPGLGGVVLVDHGASYYSLSGRLARLDRKEGDLVAQGDAIGATGADGTPVYFEIRSRNVPVDPMEWMAPLRRVAD